MEPLSRRVIALAVLTLAAAGLLGTLVPSDDPDMFHHLALGREIVRTGFPATEPFLYPLRGEPYGAPPYWLGSVAIYAWHVLFGDGGLSFLPAVIGSALAALLLIDSTPRGRPHSLLSLASAALPIALALETYRYRAVPRTEIFSALFLAWTMLALRAFEQGRRLPLLLLPLVAVAWTNVHPGTAVALVAVGLFVAGGLFERAFQRLARVSVAHAPSWRALGVTAVVLIATFAASGVHASRSNPVFGAVRFALAALRIDGGAAAAGDTALTNVLAGVEELRGSGIEIFKTPAGVLMALVGASFLLRPRAIRVRELATVAAFAALPFNAVRFAMFFTIVAAPIAARNLSDAIHGLPALPSKRWMQPAAGATIAALALCSLPLGALAPHIRFGTGLARGTFPIRGADYLQSIGFEGHLFNSFQFGGYLEWRRIGPPFQDGRGGTRPEDALAIAGPLCPAFEELDARYRFDALLLAYPGFDPVSNPSAWRGVFDPDRNVWALVAFDDGGLLYLRRDGRYGALAERDQFAHIAPADPLRPTPCSIDLAIAEYARSVADAPGCHRCRFILGSLATIVGEGREALHIIEPARQEAVGAERDAFNALAARAAVVARGETTPPAR